MTIQTIPSSGITLQGAPNISEKEDSAIARSAVLLRLNEDLIKELRACSQNEKTLQVLGGKVPKLRLGAKTVDLQITSETFRHELYTSSGSSQDLSFAALVTQQAAVKPTENKLEDTAGADAALANLKQSLASFAQEKEAKKTTISSSITSSHRNNNKQTLHPNRALLDKTDRLHSRLGSPSSKDLHTAKSGAPSTLLPLSDKQNAARMMYFRYCVLHYLATSPATEKELEDCTKIPTASLLDVLSRIAERVPDTQTWKLTDKSFKELEVWKFSYTEEDRQKAIDNTVRAYDRMRLSKEDKLWQMLLPREERGKGKILSRLHQGNTSTPKVGPLSEPAVNKAQQPKTTPAVGASSTPKVGSTTTKKGGMSIEKRLKESKKQRAAEEAKEAKEQKKREKDAVASDRETKARVKSNVTAARKPAGKIKSDAVVHSSDEDDPASRTRERATSQASRQSAASKRSDSKVDMESRPAAKLPTSSTSKPKTASSGSPNTSDASVKAVNKTAGRPLASGDKEGGSKAGNKPGTTATAAKPKSDTPRVTPSGRSEKHAAPPVQRQQLSPKKNDNRPRIPSPLGPVRARNMSDVSDRSSGYSLMTKLNNPSKPLPKPAAAKPNTQVNGAAPRKDDPKRALEQTSSGKKRTMEESSDDVDRPRKTAKINGNVPPKPAAKNNVVKNNSQIPTQPETGLKRKSQESEYDNEQAQKHRRTDSSSSRSVNASTSSLATTTAGTSVATPSAPQSPSWERSSGVGSPSSEVVRLSWERALEEAEKFRTTYYPAYVELYDRLQALPVNEIKVEDRKKLKTMHDRLKQMKEEIKLAAH